MEISIEDLQKEMQEHAEFSLKLSHGMYINRLKNLDIPVSVCDQAKKEYALNLAVNALYNLIVLYEDETSAMIKVTNLAHDFYRQKLEADGKAKKKNNV